MDLCQGPCRRVNLSLGLIFNYHLSPIIFFVPSISIITSVATGSFWGLIAAIRKKQMPVENDGSLEKLKKDSDTSIKHTHVYQAPCSKIKQTVMEEPV